MPSSPTTRNRFELIAPGEQLNGWGGPNGLNRVITLLDASLDGWVTISGTSATLTSNNYTSDQSRLRCIKYTGSTTGTITIPSVEKWYFVYAVSADVVITTGGGTTATVKSGERRFVICDASNCYKEHFYDFGGDRVQNIGTPTQNTDAVTKQYADGLAFAETDLPGINSGTTGKVVTNDGSAALWDWGGYQGKTSYATNRTVILSDRAKWLEASGAITFTMDAATTLQSKYEVILSNAHTAAITVGVSGADTIDGRSSITLAPGDRVRLSGDGVSAFQILAYMNANPGPHVVYQDQKASGTSGGASVATSYQTRTLNTQVRNTVGASIASNAVTIPAGTWAIEARAPGLNVNQQRLRIYNQTDAASAILGPSGISNAGQDTLVDVTARGVLTITAAKAIRVEHYTLSVFAEGLGAAASTGEVEIYTQLFLTRVWP